MTDGGARRAIGGTATRHDDIRSLPMAIAPSIAESAPRAGIMGEITITTTIIETSGISEKEGIHAIIHAAADEITAIRETTATVVQMTISVAHRFVFFINLANFACTPHSATFATSLWGASTREWLVEEIGNLIHNIGSGETQCLCADL